MVLNPVSSLTASLVFRIMDHKPTLSGKFSDASNQIKISILSVFPRGALPEASFAPLPEVGVFSGTSA